MTFEKWSQSNNNDHSNSKLKIVNSIKIYDQNILATFSGNFVVLQFAQKDWQ